MRRLDHYLPDDRSIILDLDSHRSSRSSNVLSRNTDSSTKLRRSAFLPYATSFFFFTEFNLRESISFQGGSLSFTIHDLRAVRVMFWPRTNNVVKHSQRIAQFSSSLLRYSHVIDIGANNRRNFRRVFPGMSAARVNTTIVAGDR